MSESSYYPIGQERHQGYYGYGGERFPTVDSQSPSLTRRAQGWGLGSAEAGESTPTPHSVNDASLPSGHAVLHDGGQPAHVPYGAWDSQVDPEMYYGLAERPYGGQPWRTAPPLPDACTNQVQTLNLPEVTGYSAPHNMGYGGAGTTDRPYGERYAGSLGNYGPPPSPWDDPWADPARNACHAGISIYSVEDFRDVPIYFAGLMKHRQQLDALALAFSSAENAYKLHREIGRIIKEQMNLEVAKQSNQILASIMFNAYLGYATRYRRGVLEEDITYLNNLVVDALVPRALANMRQLIGSLPTQYDRVAQPIPLPVNVSKRGLDARSTFDLTRFLP